MERLAGHCPYRIHVFAKDPRTYRRESAFQSAALTLKPLVFRANC